MNSLSLKQKVMLAIGIIGAILIAIFQRGIYSLPANQPSTEQNAQVNNQDPNLISSNPTDNGVILPSQVLELTFNLPIENIGEFKNRIEPKIEYKIELSDDRKTAKIIPAKPLPIGTSYTLIIQPDTKFDGKKSLNKDIYLHFRTIDYKGV